MLTTKYTPQQWVLFSLFLLLLSAAATVMVALSVPRLSVSFQIQNDELQLAQDSGQIEAGTVVSALVANGQTMRLRASDFYEEPDFFASYAEYNEFMARQSQLTQLLQTSTVSLLMADERSLIVSVSHHRWYELPVLFWLQVLVAAIFILMGISVWSFRQTDIAARYYCATSLAFGLVIFPAAIYSSRDLAMDGDLFRWLSIIDHLGLYLVIGSMLVLLWVYPEPFNKSRHLPKLTIGLSLLWWVLDTLQWLPSMDVSTRVMALGGLCLGIVLLLLQWRKSKGNLQHRVIIRWFLLMLMIDSFLFSFLVFLPPLLGYLPLLPQGLAFACYLLVHASLAVGVARYRLFDLDNWWFEVWIWIGAGAVVILLDLLLAATLSFQATEFTWLALALTGWLYFPLRQWLLGRFMMQRRDLLKRNLPAIVQAIAGISNSQELAKGWEACLQQVFNPTRISHHQKISIQPTEIAGNGLQLATTLPSLPYGVTLEFADQGRRLFNRNDVQVADGIADLFVHASESLKAKSAAVVEERDRIREDIHDSLGGHILAIMHQQEEPVSREFARAAWREFRDILSALDQRKEPLSLILAQWRQDFSAQLQSRHATLHWLSELSETTEALTLSGFIRLNLGQILREAVTNALRHAEPTAVTFRFYSAGKQSLCVEMIHDGCQQDPADWQPGRGLHHMRKRIERLKGALDIEFSADDRILMKIVLPEQVLAGH